MNSKNKENRDIVRIINFFKRIIFGSGEDLFEDDEFSTADLFIQQLTEEFKSHFDVNNVMRKGGLLSVQRSISRDLESLLVHVKLANGVFYANKQLKNLPDPKFENWLIRDFYKNLGITCNGGIDCGLSSNRFVYHALHSLYYEDTDANSPVVFEQFFSRETALRDRQTKILNLLLRGEEIPAVRFQDAQFWGNVAKNLIKKSLESTNALPVVKNVPESFLRDIQILYDAKCRSLGQIVHPFAFDLVFANAKFDPQVWRTGEHLIYFIQEYPDDVFSRSVRELTETIICAVLNADESLFPKNVTSKELLVVEFIRNVCRINDLVPKVESRFEPPKLIDVFQRLLAYTNYDEVWRFENTKSNHCKKDTSVFLKMFLENLTLKKELNNIKKITENECR